ncbi:hypothetical protein [Hungatella sp.]|uniref:hypothetical protein n=1 Tax=Hungatella sp. TaxID=2613924 RepID=UPI002A7F769D|nr:hypothetical protein [Hungatella sp.]
MTDHDIVQNRFKVDKVNLNLYKGGCDSEKPTSTSPLQKLLILINVATGIFYSHFLGCSVITVIFE